MSLSDDWNNNGEFDAEVGSTPRDTFSLFFMDNLDLHVVPAGTTDLETATWKASSTAGPQDSSVEHIFAKLPNSGQYEIWAQSSDPLFGSGPHDALAWWMASAPPNPKDLGDYSGDGTVGPEDYTIWRNSFGSSNLAADGNGNGVIDSGDYVIWRKNEGMTVGSGTGSVLSTIPEPSSLSLLLMTIAFCQVRLRRPNA